MIITPLASSIKNTVRGNLSGGNLFFSLGNIIRTEKPFRETAPTIEYIVDMESNTLQLGMLWVNPPDITVSGKAPQPKVTHSRNASVSSLSSP